MAEIDPGLSLAAQRSRAAAGMLDRMVAHAASCTTDRAPRARPIAGCLYLPTTLCGRAGRIVQPDATRCRVQHGCAEPGDVMLFEAAGPSIIVGRGKDGTVRAYRNICTHRAAKLLLGEEATCQRKPRLTCPFHAWTFDLDGKLIAQPGKAGFEDHPDGARNLMPVSASERNGIIFIQIEGEMDLGAHLGAFAPILAMMELGTAEPVKRGHLDCAANWKYALDTYGEGCRY